MEHRDANGIPTIRRSIPLVLFGFGLVFTLVIAPIGVASGLLLVFRGVDEGGDAIPPEWRRLFSTIGVLQLLLLMLLAATAYLFFRRRRIAPRMIIAIIVAGIAVCVIDAAWRVSLAQGDAEYIAEAVAPLVPRFFIQLAWLLYFLLSKRVKETFVYPLLESEATVASS
jgi:asparagine N-glycosylation enzyme membrane subunit Stt3